MGLFDFLKKGEEKPVQKPVAQPAAPKPVAAQPVAAPQAAAQDTYTVKSGDSLSKIAKNFYGDASQWHKIHQANLDKIKDPNLIEVGWQLKIPKA
ncbi:LysM peptidoglycan-binding domain-containing protein [Rufibacter sediminis]|uniref:LysM peptidoglycan-binding domain-containing protein n=1 Tax=Rufibacter sediminis TaxID=2762756 RepID=A0ABR6VWH0_9BACT|nr:LysM peptidoglycan-binding domain-containing protein [Rufibacter sediminis]MBC3541237.1 LysM peptidoglycan-binding domain-containing protein [Rufibacter sediminis]